MLDFEIRSKSIHATEHPVCVDIKMPVDFTSYLLSASPPGFDLHYQLRSSFGLEQDGDAAKRRHNNSLLRLKSIMANDEHENDIHTSKKDIPLENGRITNGNIEPDWDRNDIFLSDLEVSVQKLTVINSKKQKKNVSFADEAGYAIAAVRIFSESPDTPPQLRPELLSSLTKGATAGVTETPPLELNFPQPAANYVAFREKLDSNNVSLENVILKDYNVLGTIKVKNISFEKVVKIRCTFDSWESADDISANYVPTNGANTGDSTYDTFSFEISVPPTFNLHQKIQFCISYKAGSKMFWDNNDGQNYEVVSAEWKEVTEKEKERKSKPISIEPAVYDYNHFHGSWTEFSSWTDTDSEVPYY